MGFVTVMNLFGSVYLLSLILDEVRGRAATEIGRNMLATGLAQLVAAPVAALLEARLDTHPLTALGFARRRLGRALADLCVQRQTASVDGIWNRLWPSRDKDETVLRHSPGTSPPPTEPSVPTRTRQHGPPAPAGDHESPSSVRALKRPECVAKLTLS